MLVIPYKLQYVNYQIESSAFTYSLKYMLKAAGVFFLLAIFCAVQGQLTLSSLS